MSTSAPRRTVDVIDRRVGLMFGVFIALLAIGLLRAGYLGTIRSGALRAAANGQQVSSVVIPALRGELTDRSGVVMAISEPGEAIYVDPLLINRTYRDPQLVADKLARLVGLTPQRTLQLITMPHTGYEQLATYVPAATASRIMSLQLTPNGAAGINGIWEEPAEHRVYPLGTELGQVLGWVGQNSKGVDGLEYLLNKQLAGVPGRRRSVLDAQGKAISVQTPKPMVPGSNISLTISSPLQSYVEQVLAGVAAKYKPAGATAIVTDPQTDQLLAVANWPSVNPNRVPSSAFASVGGHLPASENQAVDLSYEPGSTFKAVTVGGALQDGLVTPDSVLPVPAYLDPYGYKITDAEPHGNEALSVRQILKYSSNIGAVQIASRLGASKFSRWIARFGFGKPTGVALPGEAQGVVPKLGTPSWSGLSMYNLPFGQGIEVSPMQMVQAYDAVADGGVLRTPQLIQSIGGRTVPEPPGRRIISTRVAAELRDMLRGVLADGGTASGAAISGYDMAGKTGTSQVVINGKYSNNRWVASFIGMVPASAPKLLVAVVVYEPQNGEYGGSVAAPAFQKIVGWAVPRLGINPCPSPCPASAYQGSTPSTP